MNLVPNSTALFSDKEQGMSVTEWDEIQKEVRERIAKRHSQGRAIWIPGNVPSLKNNKEIISMYLKYSQCCKQLVHRSKVNDELKAFCTRCNKETRMKRPTITSHKRVKEYQKSRADAYKYLLQTWKRLTKDMSLPYILGLYFVRDSKRIFDYSNAGEIIQDMFTEHHFWSDDDKLNDDNAYIMKPEYLGFHVDPLDPGVFIIPLPKSFMRLILDVL